jgi:hypothetical protein
MATKESTKMRMAFVTLKKHGIKTTADLDDYIKVNPRVDRFKRPYLMSRYGALVELVGEQAADGILQEMAMQQYF